MLTEAIHSTADTVNQVLLLTGTKRSKARADDTHAFGYGLEIYFWTFVVAVMVLLAGGAASIYEGVRQVRDPEPLGSPVVSFVVLALSFVFEGTSLGVGIREYKRIVRGRKVDGEEVGLWRFIILSKDPNLYESLLEDSAALVGIVIAAAGVAASSYLHWLWADGVASILIGLLLVADSTVIAMATRSLIAGESVSPLARQSIEAAVAAIDSGIPITDIATLQLGPRSVLVALTIGREPARSATELQHDLDELTSALQKADGRIAHVLFRFVGEDIPDAPVGSARLQ